MWWLYLLALTCSALAQWDPNFAPGRSGIVHLFEWDWSTIARECEDILGPAMYAGVQISPPTENRIVNGRPWWERYQPVSYKFVTRSGDRKALIDMVKRCNKVGVRIYADVVINHMCRGVGAGTGTGGTYYDAITLDFPGVPYTAVDFNNNKNCHTKSGNIEQYRDANQVVNCRLENLADLDQSKPYVRGKIVEFMNDLSSLGVAGFRVDACKHMWPAELKLIFDALHNLSTSHGFKPGARPFIYQEVIDQGGEPITASQYLSLGRVTEFKYGINIANNKHSVQNLRGLQNWGMMAGLSAVVFLYNHDNQRGHGGGGDLITFRNPYELKMFNAFMMAYPYGEPRIMSSYYFTNSSQGPPAMQPNRSGDCGNGWVCEHRWRQIKNMAAFGGVARGETLGNWWSANNQIAFSRGNKAFIAINNAGSTLSARLMTGLPAGDYCDVISGDMENNQCTGRCIRVDGNGHASININPGSDPFIAIHVNARLNGKSEVCEASTVPPPAGGSCTDCSSCSHKTDCGYWGIDEAKCKARGCLWCPVQEGSDPWCIHKSSESVNHEKEGSSCNISDTLKTDCGHFGINQSDCQGKGCCWAESKTSGVPWCFYPA